MADEEVPKPDSPQPARGAEPPKPPEQPETKPQAEEKAKEGKPKAPKGEAKKSQAKKGEAEKPQPKKGEGEKPQARKGEAEKPQPKKGEGEKPQPKKGEGEKPKAAREPVEEERSIPAPPLPEGVHYVWGTGRRKKAIARVRIRPGRGQFLVNNRRIEEYFTEDKDRAAVLTPLKTVSMTRSWDVWANVDGGGFTGQAGAVVLGLARALAKAVPDSEPALRDRGQLTRDARMKERKKYGQKGARKRFQFSKR